MARLVIKGGRVTFENVFSLIVKNKALGKGDGSTGKGTSRLDGTRSSPWNPHGRNGELTA